MHDKIREIYLSNLEWTKIHDNMGGVIGNAVFKDAMSYEEYQKLLKTTYFTLCDKDYITNLKEENEDYKSKVEKAVELIKNKLSFETYQHLKKLYDDIDSIEEIWEDYEFEDLLNILPNGSDNNG